MAIKYPVKLIELVADGDIEKLHKYFLKNKDKTYNLSLYADYIAKNKDFDFFNKVCMQWSGATPEIKKIFLDPVIKNAFKEENISLINQILSSGVDLKDYSPTSLVYNYFKSRSDNKDIHSLLKGINWAEVENRYLYSEIYDIDKLNQFLDIVGVHNLNDHDKKEIFLHTISRADTQMLDRLLEIGCSMYDAEGNFHKEFFNKQEFYPRGGSYGYMTYRGRKNVTELFRDKNIDNEDWVNFVQRSFTYSDNTDVSQHLAELVNQKLVNPKYPIDEKVLWKKIALLDNNEIEDYLKYCEKIGVQFNKERSTLIIKTFMDFYPEKIIALADFGIDAQKFLKSDYVKSVQNDTGFTKQRKMNRAEVNEMKNAVLVLSASGLANKLEDNLVIDDNNAKPAKKMKI